MDIVDAIMDAAGGITGHEGTLTEPDFDNPHLVHDWRNHVPEQVKIMWPRMSTEGRAVAYLFAREAASAENWD